MGIHPPSKARSSSTDTLTRLHRPTALCLMHASDGGASRSGWVPGSGLFGQHSLNVQAVGAALIAVVLQY